MIARVLRSLSYRGRLTVAVVAGALVPLIALALALGVLSNTLRDQADRRLVEAVRAVAALVGEQPLDRETALRLAAQTGVVVALYDAEGIGRAASDAAVDIPPLPDPAPGAGALLVQDAGAAAGFAAIPGAVAPRGWVGCEYQA